MRMRPKLASAGGIALAGSALALAQMGPATAQTTPGRGVKGDFSLIMMVHTSASTPNFATPATRPWGGGGRQGVRFSYRSIPCTGAAPVNNISSDLPSYNSRVPGSRAPSSLRAHPFAFNVRRTSDGRRELQGRMTLTVCQLKPGPTADPDPVPDTQKSKIIVKFRARYTRRTAESLNWTGRFRLAGGTGRYKDLTGSGEIAGYFFCFDPRGCANTGRKYRDGQMVLHGSYADPTPQLSD